MVPVSSSSKIIAVTGATGVQGSSVAYTLLRTGQWHVRAITRNPHSDAAQALAAAGAEVVAADMNEEASLVSAFEGAYAIFAVTNFWEHLFTGSAPLDAGEKEQAQGTNLARAAAKTSTLEHYLWSTMAPASDMTDGKCPCPHWDFKAKVDEYIHRDWPDLASKTTFIMVGWYPSNMANFPMCKPFPQVGGFQYVWPQPCAASTMLTISGDMEVNPGLWVRQILSHPQLTKGKYITIATEILSFGQILQVWSEVSGKPAVYLNISSKEYEQMWGPPGVELATQFRLNEEIQDWECFRKSDFVRPIEIGINGDEALGLKEALEKLGDRLL